MRYLILPCPQVSYSMLVKYAQERIGSIINRLCAQPGLDSNAFEVWRRCEIFREEATKKLNGVLGLGLTDWRKAELQALRDFAVTSYLVVDLSRWNEVERDALVKIIRAKAALDESSYLKLMQKHTRLRSAMIKLGCRDS